MELVENSWVDFTVTRGPIRGRDRNRIGLIIKIKARPDIEEFLRGLSNGQVMPVDAYGDAWTGMDGKPLEFYGLEQRLEGGRVYVLENVGQGPLVQTEGRRLLPGQLPEEYVNLAFLRLVGVSSENGISVGIAGAYSGEYLKRLKLLLPGAVKQFLQDYILPVTINLQVISKG